MPSQPERVIAVDMGFPGTDRSVSVTLVRCKHGHLHIDEGVARRCEAIRAQEATGPCHDSQTPS